MEEFPELAPYQPSVFDLNTRSLIFDGPSPTSPTSPSPSQGLANRTSPEYVNVTDVHTGGDIVAQTQSRSSESTTSPARSRNASSVPSHSTRQSSVWEWNESPFLESHFAGNLDIFQIKLPFPWKNTSVGLSTECGSAYFFREQYLAVFSLTSVQTERNQRRIVYKFNGDVFLREVAASERHIVALTDQHLILLRYDFSGFENAPRIELKSSVPIGWDPRGLAIHENTDHISILVGERHPILNGWEGRIKLYRCPFQNHLGRRIQDIHTFRILVGGSPGYSDAPETLAFHPNGKSFVCTTKGRISKSGLTSSVCSWSLDGDFSMASSPFEIPHQYTIETDKTGITSACLFDSPSKKSYLLSTSSPSKERHQNDGEWSFISPYDHYPNAATNLRPLLHRLEELADYSSIHCGAVPRQGNLLALLEETGNIVCVPLFPGDRAGLSTSGVSGQTPIKLPESLCSQQKLSMGALRFDPPGTLLYAIDSKGKLIRAGFTQDTSAEDPNTELQELPTRETYEIGLRVDPNELLRPDNDVFDSSINSPNSHEGQAERSFLRKFTPRGMRRRS